MITGIEIITGIVLIVGFVFILKIEPQPDECAPHIKRIADTLEKFLSMKQDACAAEHARLVSELRSSVIFDPTKIPTPPEPK